MRWIPNGLSLLRMSMAIPLAIWLWQDKLWHVICVGIAAALTDLVDGFLAREFQWRTKLGAWLDPAADKFLITACLVTMTLKEALPVWFCAVVLFRDVQLVSGILALSKRKYGFKIQPQLTGKLATVAQNFAILLSILQNISNLSAKFLPGLVVIATGLTLISSYNYLRLYIRIFRRNAAPSDVSKKVEVS